MNTASRMESTGEKNKIQVSRETADLLSAAGKSKWLTPRKDRPVVKGKGEMETFWVRVIIGSCDETNSTRTCFSDFGSDETLTKITMNSSSKTEEDSGKTQRLVQWNVDILAKILKQIVARRTSNPPKKSTEVAPINHKAGPVFDEVKDILALPQFDASSFRKQVDPATVKLSSKVQDQLTSFVTQIARSYRTNSFHNFEHASHVTMSVNKLLTRIVNPIEVRTSNAGLQAEEDRHDHTFGITSDPLTQLACVISALIHDADHPGVSNAVLVAENDPMAATYNNKSVAEQNSVNVAWDILMQPEYHDLRACIYGAEGSSEFHRFRQIIVNIVLATDIMDKELGGLRKARWEKAFNGESDSVGVDNSSLDAVNRKATIVLEHLIQASDVAHTMQHWHVFRKWNQRLFSEVYKAYTEGRIDKDPSKGWYEGEIGFFDYYIIPLAKKLETCGVFGVSSDEYLNYAEHNRREWVEKGQSIVKGYVSAARKTESSRNLNVDGQEEARSEFFAENSADFSC